VAFSQAWGLQTKEKPATDGRWFFTVMWNWQPRDLQKRA